jgi:hypothetical protein
MWETMAWVRKTKMKSSLANGTTWKQPPKRVVEDTPTGTEKEKQAPWIRKESWKHVK